MIEVLSMDELRFLNCILPFDGSIHAGDMAGEIVVQVAAVSNALSGRIEVSELHLAF